MASPAVTLSHDAAYRGGTRATTVRSALLGSNVSFALAAVGGGYVASPGKQFEEAQPGQGHLSAAPVSLRAIAGNARVWEPWLELAAASEAEARLVAPTEAPQPNARGPGIAHRPGEGAAD